MIARPAPIGGPAEQDAVAAVEVVWFDHASSPAALGRSSDAGMASRASTNMGEDTSSYRFSVAGRGRGGPGSVAPGMTSRTALHSGAARSWPRLCSRGPGRNPAFESRELPDPAALVRPPEAVRAAAMDARQRSGVHG